VTLRMCKKDQYSLPFLKFKLIKKFCALITKSDSYLPVMIMWFYLSRDLIICDLTYQNLNVSNFYSL